MSNPLCARVSLLRYSTGLWSACVDLDHGMQSRTRVYWSRGNLSRDMARRSGSDLAIALGRNPLFAE